MAEKEAGPRYLPANRDADENLVLFEGDFTVKLIGVLLAFLLLAELLLYVVRPLGFEFLFLGLAAVMAVLEAYGGYRIAVFKTSSRYRHNLKSQLQGIRMQCPVCGAEFGRVGLDEHLIEQHPSAYRRLYRTFVYSSIAIGIGVTAVLLISLLVALERLEPISLGPLEFLAVLVLVFVASTSGILIAAWWYRRAEQTLRIHS